MPALNNRMSDGPQPWDYKRYVTWPAYNPPPYRGFRRHFIALELHNALRLAGASILAASNIKDALDLIAYTPICAAIVDVNLGGHDCSTVCALLTKRSIPSCSILVAQTPMHFRHGHKHQP